MGCEEVEDDTVMEGAKRVDPPITNVEEGDEDIVALLRY